MAGYSSRYILLMHDFTYNISNRPLYRECDLAAVGASVKVVQNRHDIFVKVEGQFVGYSENQGKEDTLGPHCSARWKLE